MPSLDGDTSPITYLVAECRDGRWLLGDDWAVRCDTPEEARQVAGEWRDNGYGRGGVGILAVNLIETVAEERS